VFFDMDGKTRSMVAEKGMKCAFYMYVVVPKRRLGLVNLMVDSEYGCPTNGYKYEFGSKTAMMGARSLPDFLDQKIHSVYCAAT
jgi:hypothetical protein